jgi:tetratricopeptide (TPR) repeat protein
LTDFDLEVAELRIGLMKSRWPFRAEPIAFSFDPKTLEEKAAWDYFRRLNSWAASHEALADTYREEGRFGRAADHYWAVAKTMPYDPQYFVAAAGLFARDRQFERAADAYRYVLRIDDSAEIHARLGMLVYQLRDFPVAITHLERAANSPASAIPHQMRAHIHTLLATAYLNERNVAMAEEHLSNLRRLAPNAPQVPALAAAIQRFRNTAN